MLLAFDNSKAMSAIACPPAVIMGADDASSTTSQSHAQMALDMLLYWSPHITHQAHAIKRLIEDKANDDKGRGKGAIASSLKALTQCLMEITNDSSSDDCSSTSKKGQKHLHKVREDEVIVIISDSC